MMNALSPLTDCDYYRPNDLKAAFLLLDRFGIDAWKMAGGHDSISWLKAGYEKPKAVIDLSAIPGLTTIRETDEGVEIGAMASLAAVAGHPLIRQRYRLLAEAAEQVAMPQIRNTGTIGGSVTQRPRCWYYRGGLPCWRNHGNGCFAQVEETKADGYAIFDRGNCAAVIPSDTAPALSVLDARFVLESGEGCRILDAQSFFVGEQTDSVASNAIKPDEILVAIQLPAEQAYADCYFEKRADHREWDFPLVNVAAVIRKSDDGRIEDARIACGAVAAVPKRFPDVEEFLSGKEANVENGLLAGMIAIRAACPLKGNGFKVSLVSELVMRAVCNATR